MLLKQRYQILTTLGQGGFGAIYQAEDTSFPNHPKRAVKEMLVQSHDANEQQQAIEAFKQEAVLLAGLTHQNLPRVYEYFEEQGRWYLVMDYIDGKTLEDCMQASPDGKLPLQQVMHIALQLCTVLDYLHSQQIIFRDLKPANVMLTTDDHLYLIDFGIARLFKPGQTKDTSVLGSPGYAAPEQYGRAQTTARADIYSLGATLHHLLSGHDPSEEPFRFPALDLSEHAPAGPALAALIMQMVEIDKEKRPESARSIKQALQLISQQPSTAIWQPSPGQIASAMTRPTSRDTIAPAPPASSYPAVLPEDITISFVTQFTHGGKDRYGNRIRAMAWSPDSRSIASSAAKSDTTAIWDIPTGLQQVSIPGYSKGLAWSQDGSRVFSLYDHAINVWSASTGAGLRSFEVRPGENFYLNNMTVLPDETRVVVAGRKYENNEQKDARIHVLDMVSGQNLLTYTNHETTYITSLAYLPGSKSIISAGGGDKTIRIWDVTTGNTILTYRDHLYWITTAAPSPDGKRVASLSVGVVHVWDATTGHTLMTAKESDLSINGLAWSPDGKYIATGGKPRIARIWDAATGRCVLRYERKRQDIIDDMTAISWSPDGNYLALGSEMGVIQIWKVSP